MSIGLNFELMLLVFFVFILCIVLLNQWLYKPILTFMDSRNAMIENDLANTNSNQSEIDAINKEIEGILEVAKKEATSLKENAILRSKTHYEQKIQTIKDSQEKDFANFMKNLENEKQELQQSLMAQMPNFKKSLESKLKTMQ